MKICGIYKITDKTTGKCYIGQSINILSRWKQHCWFNKGEWHKKLFTSPENYTFEILEQCKPTQLNTREAYYINLYNSYCEGLNETPGYEQNYKQTTEFSNKVKEGIETARLAGKQIGQQAGRKLKIKKANPAKEIIKKHSKTFGGTLTDKECMELAKVANNTYYKYKRELIEELAE